jgi:hypothetical protein
MGQVGICCRTTTPCVDSQRHIDVANVRAEHLIGLT